MQWEMVGVCWPLSFKVVRALFGCGVSQKHLGQRKRAQRTAINPLGREKKERFLSYCVGSRGGEDRL